MPSKAHLTSHSRMSGSRWVIKPLWLSGSWSSFLYSSSVYSCHLFLISLLLLGPYHFVLYWAHLFMKCSLVISNFLEKISSLSHSIVFLYFFALITEEGFLISPCHSFPIIQHPWQVWYSKVKTLSRKKWDLEIQDRNIWVSTVNNPETPDSPEPSMEVTCFSLLKAHAPSPPTPTLMEDKAEGIYSYKITWTLFSIFPDLPSGHSNN